MPRALILGGTGLIGRATARRLLAAGWQVDVTGRDPSHLPTDVRARFWPADREDPAALRRAFGAGADLLVDCVCFTAAHAESLVPLARDAGSTVMISSKAIYVDSAGNHSNTPVAPDFQGPVPENQPTMAAGFGDYRTAGGYGANKVAAEHVLLDSGAPVTVLRPSKVHGQGALKPNEWAFVKRALDRRPTVFLPYRGAGVEHPSAAVNIAALIELVAGKPGRRALNSADPDAPDTLTIARIVADLVGHSWHEVLLDGPPSGDVGRIPWKGPHPVVLDMSAAAALGYEPAGDYATTVAAEVRWLVGVAAGGAFPGGFDHEYFEPMLDYAAEDAFLATRS